MTINNWNSNYIDLLRIISAQLVLIGHATNLYFNHSYLFISASHAVGVFFLLSGFLISYSTVKKRTLPEYSFITYIVDRFARIYSALVPCLLLSLFVDQIHMNYFNLDISSYFNLKTFIANLLMLQEHPITQNIKWFFLLREDSIFSLKFFGSNLPLWSLAIEWWLYMFFGWLVLSHKSKFFCLKLLFLSIVPIYHVLFSPRVPGISLIWFAGVTIYFLGSILPKSENLILDKSISIGLFGIMLISFAVNRIILIPLTVASFWFFFTFRWLAQKPGKINMKLEKVIKAGANFSFTLYLIHYPILLLIGSIFDEITWSIAIFSMISINLFAFVFAHYTEMRYKKVANWIKHSIWYQRQNKRQLLKLEQRILVK